MADWKAVTSNWVLANQEQLMREGLKVQAAVRFLITRLGYVIAKAEGGMLNQAQTEILESKVGRHLARYSDYVVKVGRRIYVIEVKAKQFAPPLSHGEKVLMFNTSIFLKRYYVDTIARVLVLVVLYPAGLFGRSTMRGKRVYYAFLGARGSPTADGAIEIRLARNPASYRWVKASTFRQWVRATKKDAEALIQMHAIGKSYPT
jgi:hypothetical protein